MKMSLHHLLQPFLLFAFYQHIHSANITRSSYLYNQCSPSICGASTLKFPFGKNSSCSSAYLMTSCENNKVFLTDEDNTYIKYQLLQNLINEVYTNNSVRLVDTSLFGCGPIPSFHGSTPASGCEAQKWFMSGVFSYTADYRTGTFLNCTKEPDNDTLANMNKVPCLECRKTSNFCYFYDGYIDHVDYCKPFRVHIPVNISGVGNLRRVLQEEFEIVWDGDCNSCMEKDVGRCGYLDQEKKRGEVHCFCNDGIHRKNCNDGVIINLDSPLKNPGKSRIGLIVGIGMGVAFLFLCASYIFCRRRHKKKLIPFRGQDQHVMRYLDEDSGGTAASIEIFLHNYTLGRPTRFSYKQLRKYTNNFSHKIGQGGFGSVFKGQLPYGFIIAVKILDENINQIETQFVNEVLTIGLISHNHLVRLLGYCFDQSRIALIYEFMVNGSLDKYIQENNHINNGQSKNASSVQGVTEKLILTWSQLHDIAIGTAKGLAYLHEECRSRILHCDIKPNNILLDQNFQPKLSDFGLAMAFNKENSHISVTHGLGTPGYAPPEMWYVKFDPVTDKSDVYSFGMVVLEMIGKKRNFESDVSKSSEVYFPQWVFSHHVLNAYEDSGGSKWHECAVKEEEEMAMKMELVGLWCIQFKPSKRPSMRKVVDMLEGNVAIEIPPAPFDANMPPYECGGDVKIATEMNNLSFCKKPESCVDEGSGSSTN